MFKPSRGTTSSGIRLGAGLLVLVLSALTACSSAAANGLTVTRFGHVLPVTQRHAVAFHGALLTGAGSFASNEHLGDVLVVNFWASWCPPCVSETPQFELVAEHERSMHAPVLFVGVNTKDSKSKARSFISDARVSYPVIFDEPGQVGVQLGGLPTNGLPYTVVFDKHGRAAGLYLGPMTPKDLEPVIDELVREN